MYNLTRWKNEYEIKIYPNPLHINEIISEVKAIYFRDWSKVITSPEEINEILFSLSGEDLRPISHEVFLPLMRN